MEIWGGLGKVNFVGCWKKIVFWWIVLLGGWVDVLVVVGDYL